ncbi:BON domain-containing protein [Bdellovibrio sp. HCB337]|uniref:BON domain-containing protein n=1 Tax=Bdellovibrio sp. HCB337 TaxID=3394358 RepID=UPI0039A40815
MTFKRARPVPLAADRYEFHLDSELDQDIDPHHPQSGAGDYLTWAPESQPSSSDLSPDHTGKGPKDYKRADESILADVVDMLTRHHEIDASDVSVQVEHGEVILTGFVPQRNMKFLAEDVIELIPGVQEISNQLKVPPKNI